MLPRIAFLALSLLVAQLSFAQNTSALINEQLDALIKLDLKTTLPEALRQITQQTGVRLEAAPSVWELLPYGRQTPITAKLENLTLREGLTELTRALGLRFELKDEAVEIQPLPALARLGRRATLDELRTLRALHAARLDVPVNARGIPYPQLIEALAARLAALSPPVEFENRAGDLPANPLIGIAREVSLLDALEAMSAQTSVTWHPWGNGIIVLKKQEQVSNQLSRPVTLRYSGEDVTQVLADLAAKSGVPFTFRPGSIQHIPAEFRRIRLVVDNAPITQALESISAFTGLGYSYDERGVYIWNQTYGVDAGQRDPAVVLFDLGDGVNVVLPRSHLPPDVQQYIEQKRAQDVIRVIREKMQKEGFQPTTQPAEPDL
ncbi:MAG: hypothetical protein NZ561_02145 [Phycisphaerae bacterium]|nr:hypothetical protein [Phycisphaerae bacterium]MDW8263549.1 hypothetical protein [Phycisphaerales bacterium]